MDTHTSLRKRAGMSRTEHRCGGGGKRPRGESGPRGPARPRPGEGSPRGEARQCVPTRAGGKNSRYEGPGGVLRKVTPSEGLRS